MLRLLRLLFVLLPALVLPAPTIAQATTLAGGKPVAAAFSLAAERDPMLTVRGLFRFHPGDDLRWAQPGFDDSAWPLIRSDRSWASQGYRGLSGFAWYRFRVTFPADVKQPAIEIPAILTDYEVFADGQRIGGYGGMPPHAALLSPPPQVLALPASFAGAGPVEIAVRVYHFGDWAVYANGGLNAAPIIGSKGLLQRRLQERLLARDWKFVDNILLATLDLLGGLAALLLFAMRPREREYLWFGLLLLVTVAENTFGVWSANHPFSYVLRDVIGSVVGALLLSFSIAFYRALLSGRRDWLYTLAVIATCCSPLIGFLRDVSHENVAQLCCMIPYFAWLLVLVVGAALRQVRDARLLLVPVVVQTVYEMLGRVQNALWTMGKGPKPWEQGVVCQWPFPVYPYDAVHVLFLLAMAAILANRFLRSRREEERIHSELGAARSVQQVLVPESLPEVAGLHIETAYHPAQEVGGDFFQVLPLRSGATLIVIGDVAGKGVPAALTVSLVVGTLRTLAEYSESPAEMLAGLNRRLCGRGIGFTTCLALNFSPDQARLTVANAGHLPPYLNGREIVTEMNLPLGLDAGANFAEEGFALRPGDHLTVLTDGVPEAMQHRRLLGFERTLELSSGPANAIANSVRSFGQTDDITVVTVDVQGALAPA